MSQDEALCPLGNEYDLYWKLPACPNTMSKQHLTRDL